MRSPALDDREEFTLTRVRTVEEMRRFKHFFKASPPADAETAALSVQDVTKFRSRHHRLVIPGSKSFANRALVLSAMSASSTEITGLLLSDDSYWGLEALVHLGFELELDWRSCAVLVEPPKRPLNEPIEAIHLGMAGTLARFFPAALLSGARPILQPVGLTGDARLCERPLSPLMQALRQLGASIPGDRLPLTINPSELRGQCAISGSVSGQFFSGLILAAAGAREPILIERQDDLVQPDYVRMTIAAARSFGAQLDVDADLTRVRSRPVPALGALYGRYAVEADASTACYFISMAALFGFDLTITNLGTSSLQPDLGFIGFLKRLGVSVETEEFSLRMDSSRWSGLPFKGGFTADFHLMSDQAITAGVLAVFADAPIEITGVGHIRAHESDRIARLVENLSRLGVLAEERCDGFVVHPIRTGNGDFPKDFSSLLQGDWPTHRDHRFAMAGALLALMSPRVSVLNPGCCEKTAPGFFAQVQEMGVEFSRISH